MTMRYTNLRIGLLYFTLLLEDPSHSVFLLALHAFIVCRAYATSMTSVRPSVCLSITLVDCDHTVEHKVEIGK